MTPEERLEELMSDIIVAICLAAKTTPAELAKWEHRGTLDRIRISCEAITGINRRPDPGPWIPAKDGETIQSTDFKHDVYLKVHGDFWDDADRSAYISALVAKLNSAT